MSYLILMLVAVVMMIAYRATRSNFPPVVSGWGISSLVHAFGALLILFSLWQTSFVMVGPMETGHVIKRWIGAKLPNGKIIAANGEKGPQAAILGPGLHIIPMIRVWGTVTLLPVVNIPAGYFGEITTVDGKRLPVDAVIAAPWSGTSLAPNAPRGTDNVNMLDAVTFLNSANGYKGLQASVLKPGNHRINLMLYKIRITAADGKTWYYNEKGYRTTDAKHTPTVVTEINTGYVGVIKSNMDEPWNKTCGIAEEIVEQGQIRAVLVPAGCKGVWKKPFEPGAYFFNPAVYQVTLIQTRANRWTYKGGYEACQIDLEIASDGSLKQARKCQNVTYDPDRHADKAIRVKAQGWDIPVELRVLIQVTPDQAPAVVAAVGGMEQVENRIITPAIRSIVRNIGGGYVNAPTGEFDEDGNPVVKLRPTRALDFAEYRDYLETAFEIAIKKDGRRSGIRILEVKLGEPAIPPELLVARRRTQLATQLKDAFEKERDAQNQRIETEQARAKADQQPVLVRQQIATQKSALYMEQRQNEGQADRDYLVRVAEGQEAQANVLGKDRVAQLQALKQVLAALSEKPELLTGLHLPNTVVFGGNSGEGLAAILGGTKLFGGPNKVVRAPTK